jgi:4-hydroxy-tetrahydrodipicolinate reductase
MKIGLLGYGRMGKEVEKVAIELGHNVILKFNSKYNFENAEPEPLKEIDVFIDFSTPSAFLKNIDHICNLGKNIVVGTTGWYDDITEVVNKVERAGIGLIYGANFSIGMNIVFKLVELAGELFNDFKDYDVFIEEIHHSNKIDSPSGTALKLFEILISKLERKRGKMIDRPVGKISPDAIQIVSVRAGNFFGNHSVVFDSIFDTIEIKHMSKGRSGFAIGAIKAAEFIKGKKGVFKFEEIFKK